MRVCFTFAAAVAVSVLSIAGVALGGDDGMQSVLVKAKPAPVVVESAPVVVAQASCAQGGCPCANGRCQASPQLYNVEASCNESCRNRLLGGKVVRKNSKTVYKPVRR